MADVQNVAQVALEAGNSPQIIFKHYREMAGEQKFVRQIGVTAAADDHGWMGFRHFGGVSGEQRHQTHNSEQRMKSH